MMHGAHNRRSGFTLVELIVVIVILSMAAGLASVAILRGGHAAEQDLGSQILALRREAIHAGAPRTAAVRRGGQVYSVTTLPDGAVLADTALHVDPATGVIADAAR